MIAGLVIVAVVVELQFLEKVVENAFLEQERQKEQVTQNHKMEEKEWSKQSRLENWMCSLTCDWVVKVVAVAAVIACLGVKKWG